MSVVETVAAHNLDAEKAVLGAILITPERLLDVTDVLAPADFFRDAHQRVYRAMRALAAEERVIDLVTLKDYLAGRGELEEVGGAAYLASLADGVPRSMNIEAYAEMVAERAVRRRLEGVGRRLGMDAVDLTLDTATVMEKAQQAIIAVSSSTIGRDFIDAPDLAARGFSVVERLVEGPCAVTGIPTGFRDFDALTRGFQAGNLVIIAARPSIGKTSFALNLARHAADEGHHVAFFSLEMSTDELLVRLIADTAPIDGHRLQSGHVSETEYSHVSGALNHIGRSALHVSDTSQLSVFELRSKVRRLKARCDLELVVVDYIQLLRVPANSENRNLAMAEVSRSLKLLAREVNVAVVALSQLNREVERTGRRPQLSDLRDSGALEQDADTVAFLHRPEGSVVASGGACVEVIIAKQRNGPVGTVRLGWCAENTRFEDLHV